MVERGEGQRERSGVGTRVAASAAWDLNKSPQSIRVGVSAEGRILNRSQRAAPARAVCLVMKARSILDGRVSSPRNNPRSTNSLGVATDPLRVAKMDPAKEESVNQIRRRYD
jgi:hypothetical protein